MTERLVTSDNKRFLSDQIIESITEESNSAIYLFVGRSSSFANGDSSVEVPADTESYRNDVYKSMIFGKRIAANNVMKVVRRVDWESNTVYAQYDDTDRELFTKDFYVGVNVGAYSHVYKCIYNNKGNPSTIEPDFSMVSSNDTLYETSDGYVWKYLYSVSSAIVRDFGSTGYFPVTSNSSIVDATVPGTIESVKVEGSGSGYSNYLTGSTEFGPNDRAMGGNTLLYNISSNSSASSSNNFYNGCIIYIKTGINDESGQHRRIADYQVNSTAKTIVLDQPFDVSIGLGATFDIYPGVTFAGDGRETSTAIGRAIINVASNSVHKVEVLDFGSGYSTATAEVEVDPQIQIVSANLRPIISPWKGHGSDPAAELGTIGYAISVTASGTEGNTVPADNDFRTIGLLKDPQFANVVAVSTDPLISTFVLGEDAYSIDPIRLGTTATVNSSSTSVTDDAGDFEGQFSTGDRVFLTYSPGTGIANSNMLAVVDSVTNSSHMVLTTNCSFSQSGSVWYHRPREVLIGTVLSSNTTTLTLDNVSSTVGTGDTLIGESSGMILNVDTVKRGGIEKSFNTFVNADKYACTLVFGSFTEDERVVQTSSNSSATFHSRSNNVFYFTRGRGSFTVGENIVGEDSGAIATITERYGSELKYRSGDILYIENQDPISRSPSQRETFKILFNF